MNVIYIHDSSKILVVFLFVCNIFFFLHLLSLQPSLLLSIYAVLFFCGIIYIQWNAGSSSGNIPITCLGGSSVLLCSVLELAREHDLVLMTCPPLVFDCRLPALDGSPTGDPCASYLPLSLDPLSLGPSPPIWWVLSRAAPFPKWCLLLGACCVKANMEEKWEPSFWAVIDESEALWLSCRRPWTSGSFSPCRLLAVP